MSSQQTEPPLGGLDGGATLVSGPKRLQLTTLQKVGVAGLAAFVFLAFIWVDYMLSRKEQDKPPEQAVLQHNNVGFRAPPQDLPPPSAPGVPSTPVLPPSSMVPSMDPGAVGGTQGGGGNGASSGDNAIFAYTGNGDGGAAAPRREQAGQSPDAAPGQNDNSAGATRATPAKEESSRAKRLRHPDLLLTRGTIIPCTLQTAINTELAGFVKCVLPEAVRSTTGNVVLLDRGTTIVGEVQTSKSPEQERVFISWDRLETPEHVVVSLGSPGADELGRMGVTGKVNSHFGARFGNAILLSLVQGTLQAGAALAGNSGNGNGNYFNTFQSNGEQLTNSSQSKVNIPSTIEKSQGGTVSIFVAQDIDFSDVYSLRRIK